MKKITIVTNGQPSTNPRALKEAIALNDSGYTVTFIYNYWTSWGVEFDAYLKKMFPTIKWICVGGDPDIHRKLYFYTRIRFKIFRLLSILLRSSSFFQERAVCRCFPELLAKAKHLKSDLLIAHNLGALPVVAKAAGMRKSYYAFDAEDYHSGQALQGQSDNDRASRIEDRYLPDCKYVTAASELIKEAYKKRFPTLNWFTVNNVFPKKYISNSINPYNGIDPLKLFWFSQTVDKNRGLEIVLQSMSELKNEMIHFTIIGSCSDEERERLLNIAEGIKDRVFFIDPVEESKLFEIASKHDIGLALEVENTVNRNICLTNKIFTYLSAGLAIIATATDAQKLFFNTCGGVGELFNKNDSNSLRFILSKLRAQPALLNSMKSKAIEEARNKFNWETESRIFLHAVSEALI